MKSRSVNNICIELELIGRVGQNNREDDAKELSDDAPNEKRYSLFDRIF